MTAVQFAQIMETYIKTFGNLINLRKNFNRWINSEGQKGQVTNEEWEKWLT